MEIMEATHKIRWFTAKAEAGNDGAYASLRKHRWAGHLARMPMTRLPRQLLTSWVSQPRPHGRPQYTYGHALNKTLKRAGIPSEFKEWSKLAQERSNWRKAIYAKAEFPPSRQHWSANRNFYHPLACISHTIRAIRRAILKLQPHLHSNFFTGGVIIVLLYQHNTSQKQTGFRQHNNPSWIFATEGKSNY